MSDDQLVAALDPIVSRVRTDTCCVKKPGVQPSRIDEPLTTKKLSKHLGSGPAYGVYPMLPGESTTRLGVFDLDSHQGQTDWPGMQEAALRVLRAMEARGMAPVPFRSSGGRGIHIYALWEDPQDAYSVREAMRSALADAGFTDGTGGVWVNEIEVFPKQSEIVEGRFGSMFVLPMAAASVPLDAFELDDLPKEAMIGFAWPLSRPVEFVTKPVYEPRQVDGISGDLGVISEWVDAVIKKGELADLPYEDGEQGRSYLQLIVALYRATHGSDEGRALAHTMWATSPKYKPDDVDHRWDSVTEREGGITAQTLVAYARYCGWCEPIVDDFEAIEPDGDAPARWLDGWYFLTARDKLAKIGEPGVLSITGFNTRFARMMPANKNGKKESAFEAVKNGPGFPLAADIVYAAGQRPVFDFNGLTYLNGYRESSVPAEAAEYTDAGRAAVERVRAHIRLLTGDAETAHMVETWIALNVRFPGRLIGVALLVKGIPGDGKTIVFRQLMGELMGAENVGNIANAEVRSEFSGWGVGRAVRVVEELKAPGHNRHDVLNTVKPYITNPTVAVVRKGQDGFDALNTTNYACLTNYENALPIDDTDRRWWVIFSPFASIADLAALVGDTTEYFTALTEAIAGHGVELRKYFLECPLHARVHHNMRAPETEGRKRMIRAENELAGGDFLDSYITNGEYGISAEVIASSELARRLALDMDGDAPRTARLAALLESRGFHQCSSPLKWQGKAHRIYVRDTRLVTSTENELGRQRLRKLLDESAKNSGNDESADFCAVDSASDLL